MNKVIFEGDKAVGLMVEQPVGSEPIKIRAHKEVILSAGSIGSPQILMLSGIGDQSHLKDMGIEVIQHLPGNLINAPGIRVLKPLISGRLRILQRF